MKTAQDVKPIQRLRAEEAVAIKKVMDEFMAKRDALQAACPHLVSRWVRDYSLCCDQLTCEECGFILEED